MISDRPSPRTVRRATDNDTDGRPAPAKTVRIGPAHRTPAKSSSTSELGHPYARRHTDTGARLKPPVGSREGGAGPPTRERRGAGPVRIGGPEPHAFSLPPRRAAAPEACVNQSQAYARELGGDRRGWGYWTSVHVP